MELLKQDGPLRLLSGLRTNLANRQKILLQGPPGSGRSVIIERLREEFTDRAVVVSPPPLEDADSAIHALLQAASTLDRTVQEFVQRDEEPLAKRAGYVANILAGANRILFLRLPASWRFPEETADGPDAIVRREKAWDLLKAVIAQPNLPTLITAGHGTGLESQIGVSQICDLELAPVDERAVKDLTPWGRYASAAQNVSNLCIKKRPWTTPLEFRFAVALRALGIPAKQLARILESPGPTPISPALENRLIDKLETRPDLLECVFRYALVRWPLPREEAVRVAKIDSEDAPLITECLSGGNDLIVMHERIRASVIAMSRSIAFRGLMSEIEPVTHSVLASYHAQRDGASNPAASKSVTDWLERAHHLAGGGPDTSAAWATLDLRCREFYWDRGRALSLQGHYKLAAAVYSRCLERLGPDDAYAQHYFGFNLDRSGSSRDQAEQAFRRALELDPSNPWWNTRLVTFLIEQTRFLEARNEWLSAIDRVDPTGETVERSPWLARHMHRWVVSEWLDHAEVELAREVFEGIPRQIVEQDLVLSRLAQRLADAEEAQALGETIYPPYVPSEERWKGPRVVPQTSADGSALRAWYPGRVAEANDNTVAVVFATADLDPEKRRVMIRELSADDWKRAARRPPASAKGFVEIGSYEDGTVIIETLDPRPPEWDRAGRRDIIRYLGRWERESDGDSGPA